MKKSFILTFVFAAISFAGVFAQTNNTRPAPADRVKLEQNQDKASPSDARPCAETPKTRSSTQKKGEKGEKGDKGKHKGHKKGKGHSKDHTGKGKAKGHHKGHDHESQGENHQGRKKDKTRQKDKAGKVPEEAPKGRTPLPQKERN